MTSLLAVPNLGSGDLYLPQMGEILKYTPQGSASKKNNRCIKWDMVGKGHNKKPKEMIYNIMGKSVLTYGAETCSLYEDDRRRINGTEMDRLRRSAWISK